MLQTWPFAQCSPCLITGVAVNTGSYKRSHSSRVRRSYDFRLHPARQRVNHSGTRRRTIQRALSWQEFEAYVADLCRRGG